MPDIVYVSIAVAIGLFASTIIYHVFMILKYTIERYFFRRWIFFETGMYQNEETGDVIVVPEDQMKQVEHGLHKGQYVKVNEEGIVYFYDKINEDD